MRLDKFLWAVRKYKTRSLATDEVKKQRVSVNGEPAKPSRTVKAGDVVDYRKEGIIFTFKIKDLPKSRVGAKLVEHFIEERTGPEELEKAEFIKMMHRFNRAKGTGRPTKKERRDLEDFRNNDS